MLNSLQSRNDPRAFLGDLCPFALVFCGDTARRPLPAAPTPKNPVAFARRVSSSKKQGLYCTPLVTSLEKPGGF
jgi:hypothetical protein